MCRVRVLCSFIVFLAFAFTPLSSSAQVKKSAKLANLKALNEALCDAVESNKVESDKGAKLQALLTKGADADAKCPPFGWTALALAALGHEARIVHALLIGGAGPDAETAQGDTPLILIASNYGDDGVEDMVRELLDHGAKIDHKDRAGETALMVATQHDNTAVVKALLAHHPKVDLQDGNGWTALMFAAMRRDSDSVNSDIVQQLFDHGADPTIKNRNYHGQTALELAWEEKRERGESFRVAEGEAVPGVSELWKAAHFGKTDEVKSLLRARVDPDLLQYRRMDLNWRGDNGRTALMEAAYYGYFEIVQALLDAGADPNLRNGNETALGLAHAGRDDPERTRPDDSAAHASDYVFVTVLLERVGACD